MTLAFLLELVPGLIGFLGLGHMLSGRVPLGIMLMIGWLIGRQFLLAGGVASVGVGMLIAVPMAIGVPIYSAMRARRYLREGR